MIKKTIILTSIMTGVVGSVIFSSHKLVGSFFIGVGALCAAYTYLSAEAQQRENENLFDSQAQLLFGAGLGNPYTKMAMDKLFQGNASRNCLRYFDKALKVNPNDADALAIYVQLESLMLALLRDAGLQNRSVYQLRFKKTEELIERGIQTKKHLSQFYVARGILLDLRGHHKLARGWFLRSGKLRSDPYWRLLLSTSYEMERDCLSALEEVEKAIEEGAIGSIAALSYGRALLGIGEYSKALSQFRIVMRERGYSYRLLLLVKETYYFNRQPIKTANYELLTAFYVLPMNPRRAVLEIGHAIVHYCLPSFLWLIRSWSILAQWLPLPLRPKIAKRYQPEPEATLAIMLVEKNRFLAAKKMFSLAVQKSANIITLLNYCTAAMLTSDWEEAESACESVLKLDSSNPLAMKCMEGIKNRQAPSGPVQINGIPQIR